MNWKQGYPPTKKPQKTNPNPRETSSQATHNQANQPQV